MRKVYKSGESLRSEIIETTVPSGAVAIWNIGQAGVVVKSPELSMPGGIQEMTASFPTASPSSSPVILAIDPYLTHSIEQTNPGTDFVREYAPPLEPEDLSDITAVLITHHHDDHMDLETISRLHLVSPNVKFIVPAPHVKLLRGAGVSEAAVIPAYAGQKLHIGGAEIRPVAAAHTDYEHDECGHHLYLGYLVRLGSVTIYHSGDTIVTHELLAALNGVEPDIAMLPINGSDFSRTKQGIIGNMSTRDAVDLATEICADLLWPNHYDMFANNRDNPAFLVDYLFHQQRGLKFHMCAVGERYIYLK